jgi:hypothetical protein
MRSIDPISTRCRQIPLDNLPADRRALSKSTLSASVQRSPIYKRLMPQNSYKCG